MSDIISPKLREQLMSDIKQAHLSFADIFDIGSLTDMKVQFHFCKDMNPRVSTRVILHKTDEFFIENGKVVEK